MSRDESCGGDENIVTSSNGGGGGDDLEDIDLETMSSGDTTTSEGDEDNTSEEHNKCENMENNYGLQKMPSYEFKFAKSNLKLFQQDNPPGHLIQTIVFFIFHEMVSKICKYAVAV